MSEWVSVDDRLPESTIIVKVLANDIVSEFEQSAFVIFCHGIELWFTADGDAFPCIVTHWKSEDEGEGKC